MKRHTAPLTRLRAICLALPEAIERETWDIPTFRVRNKIFVMATTDNGAPSLWCKAPPGAQTVLIEAAPERFFRPPYVGHKGWIGVRLGGAVDWDEVADLVQRSYELTAPKRLMSSRLPRADTGVKLDIETRSGTAVKPRPRHERSVSNGRRSRPVG